MADPADLGGAAHDSAAYDSTSYNGEAQPLTNESTSAEIRNTLLTPGAAGQLNNAQVDERMRRRLSGASSWRGFFIEAGVKLAFLALLLLVVWAVSR